MLLKEFAWCPRIAFLKSVSIMEPETPSMRWGKEQIKSVIQIIKGLARDAEILMEVYVRSWKLGVVGVVDVVALSNNTAIVFEIKSSVSPKKLWSKYIHHVVQLTAYAISVEETLHRYVDEAYIIGINNGSTVRIRITPQLRTYVSRLASELRWYLNKELLPPPTPLKSRCRECFYRKMCPRNP